MFLWWAVNIGDFLLYVSFMNSLKFFAYPNAVIVLIHILLFFFHEEWVKEFVYQKLRGLVLWQWQFKVWWMTIFSEILQ